MQGRQVKPCPDCGMDRWESYIRDAHDPNFYADWEEHVDSGEFACDS